MSETWYEDDKIKIVFSIVPDVSMRFATPSMTEEEKQHIADYPFRNNKDLQVKLFDRKKKKRYPFVICEGYFWDGASIPKAFWRLIGPKTDPKFLIPSMIHDVLCEHHDYVRNDKDFSSEVFNALLVISGVNPFKRYLMKHSVNSFQTFCGWNKKGKKKSGK